MIMCFGSLYLIVFGHIQNQGQAMPARPALLANSAGRAAKIVELDQLVAKLSRAKLLGL